MTPDDIQVIADLIGERLEQVYGELESVKTEVRDAVTAIRDTAQVLYDNDTAIMAEMALVKGDPSAEFVANVSDSWRRFITAEAQHLGLRIIAEKS